MKLLKIGTKIHFGNLNRLSGTIVGYGTMTHPGSTTPIATYAVHLDEKFQGILNTAESYISTMLVCVDGVTVSPIQESDNG